MRFIRYLSFACALLCASLVAHANNLVVVTDQTHPVQNLPAHARLIHLDAADQFQQKLSQNLPDDPEQAAQMARQRLQDGGQAIQHAMRGLLQGAVDAWSLGVVKVPAVVIDQRYVVYGESDVNQAVLKIKRYQEQK